MLFVIHFAEGDEIVLVRDIEVPIQEKLSHIKANSGGVTISWTAFSKSKKIIETGVINSGGKDD